MRGFIIYLNFITRMRAVVEVSHYIFIATISVGESEKKRKKIMYNKTTNTHVIVARRQRPLILDYMRTSLGRILYITYVYYICVCVYNVCSGRVK